MMLASVLLCLVLGSSYLVAGMFAKYATSDGNADASRVAKFNFYVKDGTDSHIVDLNSITKPGDSESYSFSVHSASEVSVDYILKLSLNGSMPLTATLKENGTDDGSISLLTDHDPTEGIILTDDTGNTFVPNIQAGVPYTLTVVWPTDENNPKYASGSAVASLVLTVTGVQVD